MKIPFGPNEYISLTLNHIFLLFNVYFHMLSIAQSEIFLLHELYL